MCMPQTVQAGAARVVRAVAPPVQRVCRRIWESRGTDLTYSISAGRCLVVAPHPDDETLGCGATIMRKRDASSAVRIVIASDGANSHPERERDREDLVAVRREEAVQACAVLGVEGTDLVFLGLPDGGLADRLDDLTAAIRAEVDAFRPEQVLIPVAKDGHVDHNAVNLAAHRALSGRTGGPEVFEYPISYWDHWPFTRADGPHVGLVRRLLLDPVGRVLERSAVVVSTTGYVDRKHEALAQYRSQVGDAWGRPAITTDFVQEFVGQHEVFIAAARTRWDSRS